MGNKTRGLFNGRSPLAPFCAPPIRSTTTSLCSSINEIPLLKGTYAVNILPFFVSCTLQDFLFPDEGFFGVISTFSSTIPRACGAPSSGSYFFHVPKKCEWLLFLLKRTRAFLFRSILPGVKFRITKVIGISLKELVKGRKQKPMR